ncbi:MULTISPECIES: baseplate J/gp47 family protein [unclassified Meiothermus]|uniref:baseplate J/gp47 family protein n=1 Tax=unclassified Meiothermus TaxID=370471 RepID=UPI000D7C7D66|nr:MULTISPECIES: baseplate J/gp47 family protein [unclassified Meiothermus]PZA07752.1 baseplate J protein [Meiothermus sp. Pnk-1]RYM38948.1 baseplate J protein [Meiothermus sp. PNK-Is4]
MPEISLQQLLSPKSADQVLGELLTALAGRGFVTNDWYSGGWERTLLEVDAAALADLYLMAIEIAKGGYGSLAKGGWLDAWAFDLFGLERYPAVRNVRKLELRAEGWAGPYTIAERQLWASSAQQGGLLWNNTEGGTLPPGGTLLLTFEAEGPGAQYNVPGGTIRFLVTPLPGVSVTNPPDAILTLGADAETDASLLRRARLQWAKLSRGRVRDFYEAYARDADPSITKVKILDQHPRGMGTVDVILWGEGGLSSEAVARANALIQEYRSITANVAVYAATPITIARSYRVEVYSGYKAQAQAAVTSALAALERGLEIGGTLYHAAIIEALMVEHVRNVVPLSGSSDTALEPSQVAVLNLDLQWMEV